LDLFIAFVFLLFPVVALFVGLFLEEIADAVETRYYRDDPELRPISFSAGLLTGARFFLVVLGLNLLCSCPSISYSRALIFCCSMQLTVI
jgi:uncharacterized protein involved in cysteine biosynthesis